MNSYYGLLQAFADALKLLLKEYVAPTQANMILFFLGPVITLIFALLAYAVIPYTKILTVLLSLLLGILLFLVWIYFPWKLGKFFMSKTHSLYTIPCSFHSLTIFLLLLTLVYGNFYFFGFLIVPFHGIYSDMLSFSGSSLLGIYSVSPKFYRDRSNLVIKLSEKMTDEQFTQWFAGFVDGEGYFSIVIAKNSIISFRFGIHLHIDDLKALEFIKHKLGCGLILSSSANNTARFELNSINDIVTKLIPLLDKFPLNGIKYLDYLAFKEAIAIKNSAEGTKDSKYKSIIELKTSMNTKRVNFDMPSTHSLRITPYWLLGLIEAEGSFTFSFSATSNIMKTAFYLSLTETQAPLIHAIKGYLDSKMLNNNLQYNLPAEYLLNLSKIVGVYCRDGRGGNAKPTIAITVGQIKFIVEIIIPALSSLNFVTKKYMDFLDWAFISTLIYTGKHTTEAGKKLILLISKRMNDKSLSSYRGESAKEICKSLLDEVINMEDIYIKGEEGLRILASDPAKTVSGQLFYILGIGSNGETITFANSKVCAEYFQVTSATINTRIVKRLPILNTENVSFTLSRKLL